MDLRATVAFTDTNRLKDVFARIGSARPIAYTWAGPCTSTPLTFADVPHATWGHDPLAIVLGKSEFYSFANDLVALLATSNTQHDSCLRTNVVLMETARNTFWAPICGNYNASYSHRDYDKPVTDQFIEMNSVKDDAITIGCPERVTESHDFGGLFNDLDFAGELLSAREDIAALLDGMLAGQPLDRPNSFMELCDLAARQSDESQEVDIAEWSKRLAQDLGKLTD